MANKNPIKQLSLNSSTYDVQDNTLEPGVGVQLTVSTTEGSKNVRTLSAKFGTTSDTVCVGNDPRLSDERNPIPHATSATTYGIATKDKYGHAKLVSGDLAEETYTDGYAASIEHTHGNYQPKFTYYHHSAYLYYTNIEVFIDWWSTTSTAYTSYRNFLNDLWAALQINTSDTTNLGGIGRLEKRQFVRARGAIKNGSYWWSIAGISAVNFKDASQNLNKYISFLYSSNSTSVGTVNIVPGGQTITTFSDNIID